MAGSGRGASAAWLPVRMATCGVHAGLRRHAVLVACHSTGRSAGASSVGQQLGQRAQPGSPLRSCLGLPRWPPLARGRGGWDRAGLEWLVPAPRALASARGAAWLGLMAAASPAGEGAADGFLAPRLRAHATSLPLSSAGHGKSQGQLRVGKCGNKFHLLTGGAAKDFWPFRIGHAQAD